MKPMILTIETARQIAVREVEARRNASSIFSRFSFMPVELEDENDFFWVFVAGAEELFDEGVVPNAIYVCVDKADGHIWDREEQERFYERRTLDLEPVARVA